MGATPPFREAGPFASLRVLGSTFLGLAGTRAELALVELRQEGERRRQMLVLALAAGLFLGLALLAASLFAVALFWDTHRLAAVGGVALFHVVACVSFVAILQRKARASPPPFEATLAELARDREMLRGLGD